MILHERLLIVFLSFSNLFLGGRDYNRGGRDFRGGGGGYRDGGGHRRGNPPGRKTEYRVTVENLSSRTSWQVSI